MRFHVIPVEFSRQVSEPWHTGDDYFENLLKVIGVRNRILRGIYTQISISDKKNLDSQKYNLF